MKISATKSRTHSNPTEGVVFSQEDYTKIGEIARALAELPSDVRTTIRSAIAQKIIWLEQLGDWTSEETEVERQSELERSMLTYEATYASGIIKHMAKDKS